MNKDKINHIKSEICTVIEGMERPDLNSASKVTYYKDLAKLHCLLGQICEAEEQKEYAMRGSMESYYPDDGRGGMGMDNAMRRGRGANGRYVSRDPGYAYDSYAMGSPKEQMREMMEDPNISRDAREYLRKAMEAMR